MPKYKVIYDREACIGSFACAAAAPDFWEYNEDGKADFKGATFNKVTKRWERIIEESQDYDDNQAAAEACPVYAIIIEKLGEDDSPKVDVGDWKDDPPKPHNPTEYDDSRILD
jgi:ferredoxin